MYHCNHCHKHDNDKAGWYFDGIGGAWCQNCVFLALELLDQDPPNAKEPAPTETAITNMRCALCYKFLRSDEQWQIVEGGMLAHKDCFTPEVEVGHGETPQFKATALDVQSYTTPVMPPYAYTPGMWMNGEFVPLSLKCDRCGAGGATFYMDNAGPNGIAQTLCKACRKRWEQGSTHPEKRP